MITAVIFDMDGLLLDSEVYWEQARKEYCASLGCCWDKPAELSAKGKNSREWATLVLSHCNFDMSADDIIEGVSAVMRRLYAEHLPLLPGAVSAVRMVAGRFPTGIASSSPPELIELAMRQAGVRSSFSTIVSADTVGRGKPSPDVFLVAAEQLGHPPGQVAVLEDSTSGISAARAAGMAVIAVPNPHFPPTDEALNAADLVLLSLLDLRLEMFDQLRP